MILNLRNYDTYGGVKIPSPTPRAKGQKLYEKMRRNKKGNEEELIKSTAENNDHDTETHCALKRKLLVVAA